MRVTSLVAVVAPRKNRKKGVFGRGENLLQNSVLHFVFRFSQSTEIGFNNSENNKAITL